MIWALVKDGKIENMIVADETFIPHISAQYSHCVNVTDVENKPHIGWNYDGTNFSDPNPPAPIEEPAPPPEEPPA